MKKNQLLALLLAAVMLLAVLTGCASKTEPAPVEPAQTETAPEAETATPEEDPAPAEEPKAEDTASAVTLTDMTGREITLLSVVSGGCCVLNTLDSAEPGDTMPILQASSDAVFAYINIVALRPLCAEAPVVEQFLRSTEARNVQTVLNNIEYYFFHPLRSCIARVVLEKLDAHPEDGFARITHEEISHHLGTTREVISRELEGMRQMGLLQTGRGKIYVLDRAALESMANL